MRMRYKFTFDIDIGPLYLFGRVGVLLLSIGLQLQLGHPQLLSSSNLVTKHTLQNIAFCCEYLDIRKPTGAPIKWRSH